MYKYIYPLIKWKIKPWLKHYIVEKGEGTPSEIIKGASPITLENSLRKKFIKFIVGGNSIQNGEPTPDTPVEIQNVTGNVEVKVENKNIFDITKRLLGTIDENGDLVIDGTTRKFYEDNFEENTQYTLSGYVKSPSGTVRFKLVYTDGSSTDLVLYNNTNEYKYMTFTTPQNRTLDYIRMDYRNTGKMYIKNAELMIEEGSTATDYVPHEEQTATFPLSEGQILHEGDTIEDKIVQRKRTRLIDGNETAWEYLAINNIWARPYLIIADKKIGEDNNTANVLSNKFNSISWEQGKMASANKYGVFSYSGDNRISFLIKIADLPSANVAGVKQYFSENPTTIEYNLATILETEFTQAQATAKAQIDKLYSYKGTTHITSNNEPSPIFEVQYYKEGE